MTAKYPLLSVDYYKRSYRLFPKEGLENFDACCIAKLRNVERDMEELNRRKQSIQNERLAIKELLNNIK